MELVHASHTASLYNRFWPAFDAYLTDLIAREWLADSFGFETSCGDTWGCDSEKLSRAFRQVLGRFSWPITTPSELSQLEIQHILEFFCCSVAVPELGRCAQCLSVLAVSHTKIVATDIAAARSAYIGHVNELLQRFEQPFRLAADCRVRDSTAVDAPSLTQVHNAVRLAITEAESALQRGSPQSAVDRLHTALHGYLRSVCETGGLGAAPDASMMQLYKLCRTQYLSGMPDIKAILNALAAIMAALNHFRNEASLAHPGALLPPAEAELYANAAKTVFSYLSAKLPTE